MEAKRIAVIQVSMTELETDVLAGILGKVIEGGDVTDTRFARDWFAAVDGVVEGLPKGLALPEPNFYDADRPHSSKPVTTR